MGDSKLFFNLDGRTGPDYGLCKFEAFAVDDALIIETGSIDKLKIKYANFERIDLGGAIVFPAFADAHTHFMQTGLTLVGCLFDTCRSLGDVFDTLAKFANECDYEWLLGWNLDETALSEQRLPTVSEIDAVVGKRKLWLSRVDLHSAIPSTATIDWALQKNPNYKPENGRFVKEAYNALASLIINALPSEMKFSALEKARSSCLEVGTTSVHALEGGWSATNEDVLMIADFFKKPGFHGTIYHQSDDPALALEQGWPRLGGCLFIDGSFGSRTAALFEPYCDDPSTSGIIYRDKQNIENLIQICSKHRLQLAMHAIGERAIASLTESHLKYRDIFTAPVPHRIEHFELPTPTAIKEAQQANLLISMQPAFEVLWGGPAGMYAMRLGTRSAKTNPFRTILDHKLRIAGGSDSPVTPVNPFLGIHGFLNHPTPSERITLNEAFQSFIVEPHLFAELNPKRGRLEAGFYADFVCLNIDPFKVELQNIRNISVKRTFVSGKEWKERKEETL